MYMNLFCSGWLRSSTVSSNCTSSRWSGGSLTTPWNVARFRYFRLPGESKEVHTGEPACRDKVLVQLRARIRPVRRQVCQVKIWIMSQISKFRYFFIFVVPFSLKTFSLSAGVLRQRSGSRVRQRRDRLAPPTSPHPSSCDAKYPTEYSANK